MVSFRIEDAGDEIELFINDRFSTSWGKTGPHESGEMRLPIKLVKQMCELAYAAGQDARSAEILKLLGVRTK